MQTRDGTWVASCLPTTQLGTGTYARYTGACPGVGRTIPRGDVVALRGRPRDQDRHEAVLVAMPVLGLFHSFIMHQVLLGNYPMIGRWQMHRYLLRQSMTFFANEFAGRVATKVMQTSLAVRDTWLIVTDILVYVTIYFVTMVVMVGGFDAWLLVPFLGWMVLYAAASFYFVPRLAKVAQEQADAGYRTNARRTPEETIANGQRISRARQRELAFRMGVNLVMYALCLDYKADQVHVPALLERLGR